jgi:serine/threonine protein phosphatase PrpC
MISAKTTHMGLVRTENQDSLGYIKVGANDLFVICDGVGGLPNGALASKTAVDSIISDFSMMSSAEPETHLLSASDLMERKLLTEEIGAPDNFTWYIIQI